MSDSKTPSSGNVFNDLGFTDATHLKAMAEQIVQLERQRDALAEALRELVDDVTNGEDDWVAGTSVARARALLAELEAKR